MTVIHLFTSEAMVQKAKRKKRCLFILPMVSLLIVTIIKYLMLKKLKVFQEQILFWFFLPVSAICFYSFGRLLLRFKFYSWIVPLVIDIVITITDVSTNYKSVINERETVVIGTHIFTFMMMAEIVYNFALLYNLGRLNFYITFAFFLTRALILIVIYAYLM